MRNVFAPRYVINKSVMDIACGTDYGLSLLKNEVQSVTGVDIDVDIESDQATFESEIQKLAGICAGVEE